MKAIIKKNIKWYRKNESDVMRSLGLIPTPRSGAGWINKADGQSEHIIAELKSTDANSYRINLFDLQKLNSQALVSHKLPIFVIQFMQVDETYLLVDPDKLQEIAEYIKTGNYNGSQLTYDPTTQDVAEHAASSNIISSKRSKDEYWDKINKKWTKEKSAR